MALKRFTIDGYGQIELNQCAFRRDGRIEAQCALYDKEFAKNQAEYVGGKIYAENGMILAVDNINRVVRLPGAEAADLPLAINYSTEHLYDERHQGLKDFYLPAGTFYPRLGYLSRGDKFTTNCLCYESTEFTDDEALIQALEKIKETKIYGKHSALGAIQLTKNKVDAEMLVVKYYTMPDGQPGVKFQVL